MRAEEQGSANSQDVGHLETYEAVRYVRGLFTNVAVSARYERPETLLDVDLQFLIFPAVAKVIARHPALSTVFFDAQEGSKPYYAQLPEIDLRECVIFVARKSRAESSGSGHDVEWDSLVEEYHNTRFDERWGELPLWRLVILHDPDDKRSFVAAFVHLHPIGDGNSGSMFHRALLTELSTASGEPCLDPIVRCPDSPLPESLESMHRLPLSLRYLLKMAWEDKFPSNGDDLWLGGPVSKPTRSRFLSFTLSSDLTTRLILLCRARGVTLTSTCHVLFALAIFSNLPPQKTRLKSSIACDLRRFLGDDVVGKDVMANYVSAPTQVLKRPASLSSITWAEARRIAKLLRDETSRGGKDSSSALLRYVGSKHEYFESKFGKARDGSFSLTNLGIWKRAAVDGHAWRTGRMVFSEGFDASREAICITMVTGEDECLTVGIVWGQDVVEERLMRDISETFKTLLEKTADEER